ncbi:hypothetical protein SNE40_003781 [Patella caerulea]|uniref:Uncharacterized protein n=1 Tax=Patella caerulea TaxID=87958 RepID=A0AAN8Q907_PATCE
MVGRKLKLILTICFLLVCVYLVWNPQPKLFVPNRGGSSNAKRTEISFGSSVLNEGGNARNTWVSLSVCWSKNTEFLHKQHFPYKLATKLNTRLWHMKTFVSTVVFVIYDVKDKFNVELRRYVLDLQHIGNKVILVPTLPNMSCSLQSQLQRLFAFKQDFIRSTDLVVTSDVDAFVMDFNIFKPLEENYRVWIFQYKRFVQSGGTMPMTFIAMTADDWKNVIGVNSPTDLVSANGNLLKSASQWFYDQTFISYANLKSKLCFVPWIHPLWKIVKLDPLRYDFNDSGTCFHGGLKYHDCTYMRTHQPGGCTWWHFYPHERSDSLYKAFYRISELANKTSSPAVVD